MKPTIRDDGDVVVVGWGRFEHRHSEPNVMFTSCVPCLRRMNESWKSITSPSTSSARDDKKGLCCTVDFFFPSKVRYDRKIDLKE